MHLVALAWIYVVLMMAAGRGDWRPTARVLGAVFTFVLYGVLPLSIVLYVMGTPMRRSARRRAQAQAARSAQRRIQTAAARRPVTPSRRYEKNRERVARRCTSCRR